MVRGVPEGSEFTSHPPLFFQVLALGGSVAPAEVFKLFHGREPSTAALLNHNDLLPAGAA